MLFPSYEFIFAFLPIAVLGYYFCGSVIGGRSALVWLLFCSYFFYGWWNPVYVLLLAALTLFNFAVGRYAGDLWSRRRSQGRQLIFLGIACNLAVLLYFKYTGLAIRTIDDAFHLSIIVPTIALPLGISFFVFQKIAYLADVGKDGRSEPRLLNYALFVSFFPQLIAGPIVHPTEVLPQFERNPSRHVDTRMLAMGLTMFAIGLFKKTELADNIAPFASAVFDAAAHAVAVRGDPVSVVDAWGGAIAYAMQIYFDFSGYSDMAIGLGLIFGIRLPLNFNSPYQATSIIDFWRRWHMTLSRFLRDYLYIPLGGNRKGRLRQYTNLLLTMILGGIWHGANWTFALWGLVHGIYLLVNHLWRSLFPISHQPSFAGLWIGRLVTLIAVVVAWVFFRAPNIPTALHMLRVMSFGHVAEAFTPMVFTLAGGGPMLLVSLLALACAAPNSQAILGYRPWVAEPGNLSDATEESWAPDIPWTIAATVLFVLGVLGISGVTQFIYYQF